MKVQVEEISPVERRLNIEVDAAVIATELTAAYTQLGRQVKIAGFRPGKIPRRILEQRFKAEVEDDVARRVQARAFIDAIKEHKVDAVSDPHLSGGKLSGTAPYAFTARVEVKPKLEAKDYKGLKLPKPDDKVPDEKVTEQLEKLRQNQMELVKVEGRDVAKKGDMAVISFTSTIDGKEYPGSGGDDVTVEVAPGELIEANLAQLEGQKVGETRDIDYTFPADYRVEEVKGKLAKFKITVKELKEKKLPELNDAFAEKLGVGTLADLKTRVRTDLERGAKSKAESEGREAMFKALVEKNAFEVPKSLIERGVDMMLDGAFRTIARGGIDPRNLGIDFNKLREEFRPKAELEVRGQLIIEAIGTQEKLEPSAEELEKYLEKLAEDTGRPLSQVRKQYKGEEERSNLVARAREDKTIEFLKSQAAWT